MNPHTLGDWLALAGWCALGGFVLRVWRDQRIARRKGARLAPHVRRGRVPCANPACRRLFWTDHGWQGPIHPELYCSPSCVPTPTPGDEPR